MSRTALVTGGAGFIGSHLVELLLWEGWRVRVLDDFSTGTPDNLPERPRPGEAGVEVVPGDVRDRASCESACAGIDTVFHLAAVASVPDSIADPARCHEVNVSGTLNLLLAARNGGVRRFVFSSSASVYGDARTIPTTEKQPVKPLSPYAATKAIGEMYCSNFHTLFGLETVVLRYFNVFGPRQSADSGYAAAIPKFVRAALRGEAPLVFGDGRQTRDFVYVENVAAANLLAAVAGGAPGGTFNIAGGTATSLLQLIGHLREITGARLRPAFQPARAGDVRHSRADITRARSLLGYETEVSVADGLRRTVDATRSATAARPAAPLAHAEWPQRAEERPRAKWPEGA